MPVNVECGEAITVDTALAADVGPCPADGIIISVDGITLDLNGHRVFADNGEGDNAGVRLTGVSGVTVTNGTAEGFDAGVVIEGGSENTMREVAAVNNINDALAGPCDLGDAVAIQDSDGNTIEGNLVNTMVPTAG
jgi:secreted PhoX family phosphatase